MYVVLHSEWFVLLSCPASFSVIVLCSVNASYSRIEMWQMENSLFKKFQLSGKLRLNQIYTCMPLIIQCIECGDTKYILVTQNIFTGEIIFATVFQWHFMENLKCVHYA